MPKEKTSAGQKKVAQFVRDHVCVRLVQAGWDKDKACELTDNLTDAEIVEELPKAKPKMGALGDGSWLKWLKEHSDELREGVEKVFSLLALLGLFGGGGKAKKEFSQDEDEEEGADEEESDDEDEDDKRKKRR